MEEAQLRRSRKIPVPILMPTISTTITHSVPFHPDQPNLPQSAVHCINAASPRWTLSAGDCSRRRFRSAPPPPRAVLRRLRTHVSKSWHRTVCVKCCLRAARPDWARCLLLRYVPMMQHACTHVPLLSESGSGPNRVRCYVIIVVTCHNRRRAPSPLFKTSLTSPLQSALNLLSCWTVFLGNRIGCMCGIRV